MSYLEYLSNFITARAAKIKKDLETEEAGKVITFIQGELFGLKFLWAYLDGVDPEDEKNPVVIPEHRGDEIGMMKMQEGDVLALFNDLVGGSGKNVDSKVSDLVYKFEEKIMNYLYKEADKPRDFPFIHGKRVGITAHKELSKQIKVRRDGIIQGSPLIYPDEYQELAGSE